MWTSDIFFLVSFEGVDTLSLFMDKLCVMKPLDIYNMYK